MRFLMALTILLSPGSALFAQEQDGQADLSSNFVHAPGFPVEGELRSKAKRFLESVRPEEFNQERKPAADRPKSEFAVPGER